MYCLFLMYYDIFYLALKVKTKGQIEGEKLLEPKLRFKKFEDNYKKYKLKEIVDFYKGNTLSKSDIAEKGKTPCILYGELYTKYSEIAYKIFSFTNNCNSNLFYSKKNDVLIPCSGETALDISTSTCVLFDNIAIGGDLNVLRSKNQDGKYLSYLLSHKKRIEIAKYAQGDSIVHLYADKIKNINIYLPNYREQEKVSSFLGLLDKKIELQKRKIGALKIYKKGLLQNLKSNSKDWKEFRIKDLFNITRGQVIPKNSLRDLLDKEYKYPVYSSQTSNYGILGYDKTYDFDGQYLTWTTDGANAGKVFYRNGKFRCTNVCGLLYSSQNVAYINLLTADLLNYETPKYVSYVGNPKLMNNVMSNIKIKLPSLKIQSKISNIFIIFNKKIYIENQKLEKLNNLKKSLLQQMFI